MDLSDRFIGVLDLKEDDRGDNDDNSIHQADNRNKFVKLCDNCKMNPVYDTNVPDAAGFYSLHGGKGIVAKVAVSQKSPYYSMDHKRRGMAIIFNHEHFDVPGLNSRTGTAADCANLRLCLTNLGFNVLVYNDVRFTELIDHVSNAAVADHSDSDCFVIAVLSHGETDIIYARDAAYKPHKLWSAFSADRCPSLAGKPKMFFLQACRGEQLDCGVTLCARTQTDGDNSFTYRIPSQADFLIAYSTTEGYFSWRNTTRGSWFIQALCEELRANGRKLDIMSLLTLVCQRVAIDYESNTPDNYKMHQRKQVPCITSRLTRFVLFTDKKP